MQQRPAQGLHNQCPRPMQVDQLTSVETPKLLTRGCMDQLEHQHGRGASCRPPLRPASTAAAAASSARSCPRLPRRELAAHAAQSGERQRRSHPQTSRRLPDFEAAPWPLLLHPLGVVASAGYVAPRRPKSVQPPWGTVPHVRGRNGSVWGRCCRAAVL